MSVSPLLPRNGPQSGSVPDWGWEKLICEHSYSQEANEAKKQKEGQTSCGRMRERCERGTDLNAGRKGDGYKNSIAFRTRHGHPFDGLLRLQHRVAMRALIALGSRCAIRFDSDAGRRRGTVVDEFAVVEGDSDAFVGLIHGRTCGMMGAARAGRGFISSKCGNGK